MDFRDSKGEKIWEDYWIFCEIGKMVELLLPYLGTENYALFKGL